MTSVAEPSIVSVPSVETVMLLLEAVFLTGFGLGGLPQMGT